MNRSVRTTMLLAPLALALTFGAVTRCSSDQPAATWKKVAAPTVKDQTDDVVVTGGSLDDGTYWATVALASGSGDVIFRVLKARFGATCTKWAKDNGMTDACLDDYNVESYPDAYVSIARDATVSVAKSDGPGTSYSINAKTLQSLMDGRAKGLPTNYSWVPFPFVVTVSYGWVTNARQYWVP